MPQVPFHYIFQTTARLDRRDRVCLDISNLKPHYIANLGSSSETPQETSMARSKHIPSYRQSKFPLCSPSHTPVSNSIPSHPLPHTHPTTHINLLPSLLPFSPPHTPSYTWDIPGCLGRPHRSHYTNIQGWIPLPVPVPDAVVYPVVRRG